MIEQLPWVLIIGTALLLAVQLFVLLNALKHLLGHDVLPTAVLSPAPFISVLVPARNEAEHIKALLDDLRAQDYPSDRFEVIVVDDGSEDDTQDNVFTSTQPTVRLIELTGATGKKAAIEKGVSCANGDIILLTDADGRCGPLRLKTIAQAWRAATFDLLLMPIAVRSNNSLLFELQANEQAGFMAVAIASARAGRALIANGANMAFRRSAFQLLDGYDGNRHFASGDDMFLLRKMQMAHKTVTCLAVQEVVVHVPAVPSWRTFLDQRLRWAGKMKATGSGTMSLLPAIALLLPVLLWWNTVVHFRLPLLVIALWSAWLVPLVVITTSINDTIDRKPSPFAVALDLVLFSLYAPTIAILSLVHKPIWKGRRT
jgi:cellulose synthase/poly-beta-1,6-N-acetylglucosamine synthase-like glycosyltransferase